MPSIEQKRNNNNLMIAWITDFWAKTTFIRADRKPIKNFTFRMAKKCLSLKKLDIGQALVKFEWVKATAIVIV